MTGRWPHAEFGEYLRALMREAGIKDFAELSRIAGLNQSLFSNWRRGQTQPSHESLRKIAPALKVSPASLYMAAGLAEADELDLDVTPDLTVLPAELRALIELWPILSADQQMFTRRSLAVLVGGLRAETAKSEVKPSVRRRPA